MTKDRVLELLRAQVGEDLSGAALAKALGVSRTAVWKAVEQLRGEGWRIDSASGRGYRLLRGSDALSEAGIRAYLKTEGLTLRVYNVIGSTNTELRAMAEKGAAAGTALIAAEQTAGRGRMGRSFYSPAQTGLYLSLLLRPELAAADAGYLTAAAAVAAAEAIEAVSGRETKIKWVNDVLLEGKKVCGILTEAATDLESGALHYAVVGVGVNLRRPAEDFPPELLEIAGAVFGAEAPEDARQRLAAALLDNLAAYCGRPKGAALYAAYRKRSVVVGQDVLLLSPGRAPQEARVLDVAPDFSLRVRYPWGGEGLVRSGEVSVRPVGSAGPLRKD